jgi:uncharacterized protein YbjT (DUF2867 family)
MKIFLTGATGFIGSRLARALRQRGHLLICSSRRTVKQQQPPGIEYRYGDFGVDFEESDWRARLEGVDVVVNAVGIIRENRHQTFEALHVRAPCALFAAAASAGLRCVQVSALGADEGARSRYHRSKKRADDFLASVSNNWVIVQPSLVLGIGGSSTRLFTMLASLPLIPLPGHGEQPIQPILIDDVVEALVRVIESTVLVRRRIALVGPGVIGFRELLAHLRGAMELSSPRFIRVPIPLLRPLSRLAGLVPGSLLDAETLEMLVRGNTADPSDTRRLLQRDPRPVADSLLNADRASMRTLAALHWLLPVLRLSVALVWILTGIFSLGVYPKEQSYALLARTGLPAAFAAYALYGAAIFDLLLGIATLLLRRRRGLWLIQMGLIITYTLIITLKLPEFWLHPYGPILKNLPLLAVLWMLYMLEPP